MGIIHINVYASNIGTFNYIKQILKDTQGKTDNNKNMVEEFNAPPTQIDGSSRQKNNKAKKSLNNTVDQLDLIDIHRTLHPKKKQNMHYFQTFIDCSIR